MKQARYVLDSTDDYLECFTNFRMNNRICREFCAVRLRCLIEKEIRVHPDFFDDDMFTPDELSLRTQ